MVERARLSLEREKEEKQRKAQRLREEAQFAIEAKEKLKAQEREMKQHAGLESQKHMSENVRRSIERENDYRRKFQQKD